MIIVVRRSNVVLLFLVFVLLVTVYALNTGTGAGDTAQASVGLTNRTIIVDAGHGGEDPGAVSDYSGLREKDVTLIIAKEVKVLLEDMGCKVTMTREKDVLQYKEGTRNITSKRHQDLTARKKLMDESDADIVVSIHLNKFPQTQYYGAQTFYPPNAPESRRLAECIQNALREKLDPGNKRTAQVKKEPIIIFQNPQKPTALVECGFLSNKEEERKLADPEYQKKIAAAVVSGINDYFRE